MTDTFDFTQDEDQEEGFNVQEFLDNLNRQQKETLLDILGEIDERHRYNVIAHVFPDTGPLRRELYKKHIQYLNAGNKFRERCFMAANRVGKSYSNAYECALHLTGRYPEWWKGKRFKQPIRAWMSGSTGKTTRDIIQPVMLGPIHDMGTGMLPKDSIVDASGKFRVTPKAGLPGAKETVFVKHISGGYSELTFKSYEQGREGFEGTAMHYIGLDEECPSDIYSECLTRTMTVGGIMNLTFTPLRGITEVVTSFLPSMRYPATDNLCGPVLPEDPKDEPVKWFTTCDWDDVPHLADSDKRQMLASYSPHEKEARSRGIPSVGSGKVYPVPESEFVIAPIKIPPHWSRGYAIDPGFTATAAVFFAYDEDNDVVYITEDYKVEKKAPTEHAAYFLRKVGNWMPGVIDPAGQFLAMSKGKDRIPMLHEYLDMGLNLRLANNQVEPGILNVYNRLMTGRLKVFSNCQRWLEEFRIYRRKEDGTIFKNRKKSEDDLMDATRYAIMSGIRWAEPPPDPDSDREYAQEREAWKNMRDRSRNNITGY